MPPNCVLDALAGSRVVAQARLRCLKVVSFSEPARLRGSHPFAFALPGPPSVVGKLIVQAKSTRYDASNSGLRQVCALIAGHQEEDSPWMHCCSCCTRSSLLL